MILGISGKACSGKNAASSFLEQKGFTAIDVDKLGHEALEMKRAEVAARFGENLILPNGLINRKKLGSLVFKNILLLKELEDIVHPVIFEMVQNLIQKIESDHIIINAAILGTSGMDVLCDKVLWIETSLFKRIKRAIIRDKNKISHIFSRIRSQRDLTVQHFSEGVDIYMVRNRGSLMMLEKQIDSFLKNPEKFKRV